MYSYTVKVALPPPQLLAHSFQQCLIIGLIMSSQPFFQRTEQVIIWWCEVRIVGWMWQHCPSELCDGLCGVHVCVWFGIAMEEQYYTDTVTSPNVHLQWKCLTRKMSKMLVLRYNTRPHTSVRITDTIINFGLTVLPHLPFSPGLTRFRFSGRQKKRKPEQTWLRQWWGTAECRILVAADGQCLSGGNAGSCSKVEEVCWQRLRP